jgi:hypothetical protein
VIVSDCLALACLLATGAVCLVLGPAWLAAVAFGFAALTVWSKA